MHLQFQRTIGPGETVRWILPMAFPQAFRDKEGYSLNAMPMIGGVVPEGPLVGWGGKRQGAATMTYGALATRPL